MEERTEQGGSKKERRGKKERPIGHGKWAARHVADELKDGAGQTRMALTSGEGHEGNR